MVDGSGDAGDWDFFASREASAPVGPAPGVVRTAEPATVPHAGPPGAAHPRRTQAIVGTALRGLGELLITAGLVVLLFVVYELWVTDLWATRDQHRLHTSIERTWAAPPVRRAAAPGIPKVALGDGLAILRIPRFGRTYAPVVVEGVATSDLQKGPGHYPGTALPGGVGNFVVSGHRTTYGHWFGQLDELRVGDSIVVEVADRYYTYIVTSRAVVQPTDLGVILPVPEKPGVRPTNRLLTFTTCNPKYSASTRLIVHAQLHGTTLKSRGLPPALMEG